MSNYVYPEKRIYVSTLQFTSLATALINQFECAGGERAGFSLQRFTDPEDETKELIISFVYDCSNGEITYLTSLSVMPETDLVGGLFSSGVFPDGPIYSEFTKFRKANY